MAWSANFKMVWHVLLRPLRHATARYVTLRHATPRFATPRYATQHIATPRYTTLHYATAGKDCRARLPGKTAGQDCRARLPGKTARQDCRTLTGVVVWWCFLLLRSNIPRSALCATLDTYNLTIYMYCNI
jgi:hypothetical protein